MTVTPSIADKVKPYLSSLQEQQQRGCVSVNAEQLSAIGSVLKGHFNDETLYVSDDSKEAPKLGELIEPKQILDRLGTQCVLVIWHADWNANLICAAIGLIKAGGLIILVEPVLKTTSNRQDAFERYLLESLSDHPGMLNLVCDQDAGQLLVHNSVQSEKDPYQEQAQFVADACEQWPTQNILLQGARGRGKSTALAMLSQQLKNENSKVDLAITAPAKRSVQAVLDRCPTISFVAPDALIADDKRFDILIIDEAAAIPFNQLKQLIKRASHLVIATTIDGYEGTSSGFRMGVHDLLSNLDKPWTPFQLHVPLRWRKGDMLESWCQHIFVLDWESRNRGSQPNDTLQVKAPLSWRWISQTELCEDIDLLHQTYCFLAQSHYQTSPNDLQRLLSQSTLKVLIASNAAQVVAVAMILVEGDSQDPELNQAIVEGRRRPQGHLVPQALSSFYVDPKLLKLRTWRVSRIAVSSQYRRLGIGQQALEQIETAAKAQASDYLSTSFSAPTSVSQFWLSSGFQSAWLGYSPDPATGRQSVFMVKALNSETQQRLAKGRKRFAAFLLDGLSEIYQDCDVRLIQCLLQDLKSYYQQFDSESLKPFSTAHGSYETYRLDFKRALARSNNAEGWDPLSYDLAVYKVLQEHDWKSSVERFGLSGKREALQHLRSLAQKV